MGFRIHRGIFQKLNAERTAYENTFKIGDDGRIKEVDSEGNVTAGYLKVGEQASDANTVDGLHASSFLRSDADDTASGNITFSGTMYFTDASNNNRLNKGASFVNPKDPWSNFHIKAGQGQMYLDASAYHIRPQNGSSDWVYIDSDGLRVRSGWLRVDGSQGIYFQSYGGGWRMTDSSWIRAYNDKNIYTGGNIEVGGTIRANGNGFYVDSTNVINSAGKFIGNIDNSETKSDYFIQEAHGNPRNNLGSPTVTEMALFDSQFRCMTDLSNNYTNLDRLTFWIQREEGGPWEEITTYSDTNKKRFLRTNNSGVVIPNRAYKFRVEFKAPGYVFANALYFYWSSNSHSTKVHVYKYNASQDTWHAHATSNTNVSSWPGHLYLPFSTIPWHETHTTSTGHHRYIRVEFIPNWSTGSYADRVINLYGGQIWGGYPSGRRTVHSINEDGNYYFPANLYAEGGSGDGNRLATRSWVTSTAKAADANLLDGINSTSFLRSDAADTASSKITFTAAESIELSGIRGRAVGSQTGNFIHLFERVNIGYPSGWGGQAAPSYGLSTHGGAQFNVGNVSNAPFTFNGSTIWHAGNDGSGSGLDADTVDGYHASRLFRIDSATRSGANFTDLIPSANETFLKELHQIETGVDYPAGAYTYGLLQSTKMTSMKFQWYVPHTASRGDNNTTDTIYFRTGWGGSQIYDWKYLIHSGNIAGQSVNYANSAGAVTWANVSGKPSTFAPSSHNHNKITENTTISFGQGSLQWTDLNGNGGDGLNGNTPGNPFNDWHHHIIMNHSNSNGYYVDVAYSFHHDRVHFRRKAGSDPQSWREFWHTGNLSTTKVSNWDTAYGWGNHATQGYLDTVPEEYKTQTQNDARYAAIAHNHSGVYDPAGTAQSVSDELSPRITAVETSTARNATDLATKANASGSYNQDFYVDDLYYDAWIRNHTNTNGLYWSTTGWHLYPQDNDDFLVRSGNSGSAALRFSTNGTHRNYVYCNSNNQIGFLTSSRNWALRVDNNKDTRVYRDLSVDRNVSVTGSVTAASFSGDGSGLTGISAGAPPVQATVEGGEASTLASIHFSPGEGAATFTLADGQTFRLAFAR